MNSATVLLIARYLVGSLAGALAAHGYITGGDAEALTGAVLVIVPIVGGLIAHWQSRAAVVEAAHSQVAVQATPLSPLKASPEAVAANK